jgi:lysozyme family protein
MSPNQSANFGNTKTEIQSNDLHMAKLDPLARFILSYEGGFVNDPKDRGGATNKGVTIATWRAQGYDKNGDGRIDVKDLKLITDADAINIMRKNYWNRWKADQINSQAIANTLVDWVWGSGKYAIVIPQQMLGVTADGIVGPKTIEALNQTYAPAFFKQLQARRLQFIDNIIRKNPSQKRFEAGWYRRINAINYNYLVDNRGRRITW